MIQHKFKLIFNRGRIVVPSPSSRETSSQPVICADQRSVITKHSVLTSSYTYDICFDQSGKKHLFILNCFIFFVFVRLLPLLRIMEQLFLNFILNTGSYLVVRQQRVEGVVPFVVVVVTWVRRRAADPVGAPLPLRLLAAAEHVLGIAQAVLGLLVLPAERCRVLKVFQAAVHRYTAPNGIR